MCTHSFDDLLPHAPLHYAATGEMVKGSYYSRLSWGPYPFLAPLSHTSLILFVILYIVFPHTVIDCSHNPVVIRFISKLCPMIDLLVRVLTITTGKVID